MFCGNCGKMIQEGNKFCTGCGEKVEPITIKTKIDNASNENVVKENPVTNVNNTNTVNNNNTVTNTVKDKASIGFNILAFFMPIIGLVLFLIMKKETPKKAKGIGISALVGYILSVIVSILYVIFVFWLTFETIQTDIDSELMDNEYYYEDYEYDYDYDYHYDYDYDYDI